MTTTFVVADTFDLALATSLQADVPGLGTDPLLGDVALLLWQASPALTPRPEYLLGAPVRRTVLESLLTLQEFQALHHETVGDRYAAAEVAASLTALLPPLLVTRADTDVRAVATSVLRRWAVTSVERLRFTAEAFAVWGLDKGEIIHLSYARRHALTTRICGERLAEFLRLVGRCADIDRLVSTTSSRGRDEMWDVELGDRLHEAVPSELAMLASGALRLDLHQRAAEASLITRRYRGAVQSEPGPVVICVDTSSSMSSVEMGASREAWAKALLLRILQSVRVERRPTTVILFASAGDLFTLDLPDGTCDTATLVDLIETSLGGGTNFWSPLSAGVEAARVMQECRKGLADLVLISDGQCRLTDRQLVDVLAAKASARLRIHVVGIGDEALKQPWPFADSTTGLASLLKVAA